jgi:hypothetical protein
VGTTIPICNQSEWQLSPTLCFGRTNYLVGWPSRRSGSPEMYDIDGRLVSKSESLGGIVRISQTPSPRHNPLNIAFDGTNFMAVWNRDVSPGDPSPSEWDVYGRLVSAAGTPLGSEFPITIAPGSQVMPTIGFDGLNFLVSWFDTRDLITKFRFFSPGGQPVGQEFHVFAPQALKVPFGVVATFDGERFLAIADLNEDSSRLPNGDVWGAFIPKSTLLPRVDVLGRPFPAQVTGRFGQNYAVQAATNLSSPNWSGLATNTSGEGAFSFIDTNAAAFKQRFYRAVQVP